MAKYEIRQEPDGGCTVWCAYDEDGKFVRGSYSQLSADDCERKLLAALTARKNGTMVIKTIEVDE